MSSSEPKHWNHLLEALGAEPRERSTIMGVSGIDHDVLGLGVDDKRRRLVLISAEHDARSTALMQADVQATIPDTKVLVVRPVSIDLNAVALGILNIFGNIEISQEQFTHFVQTKKENLGAIFFEPLFGTFMKIMRDAPIQRPAQIMNLIHQLSSVDFTLLIRENKFSLKAFLNTDFNNADRVLGLCLLPLYEFTEQDWDLLASGRDIEAVSTRLRELGINQYFYPPVDQTALGLVDRGLSQPEQVLEHLPLAPQLGHPFGEPEILESNVKIMEIIDALQDRELLVEGEFGMELSEQGGVMRTQVKFRPREGLLSKIINRSKMKINLSTKEWFGITKQ